MYISLDWLKDFIKLPAKIKPADLAVGLTSHTVEVERVVSQAAQLSGVVVGRVLEVGPHPNADRLRVTTVDVGSEKLIIVCGAPNVEAGQTVPVALVGTILPGGLEIKEVEIRGVKSAGMICAEDELGLGKEHAGIMVLDKKAKPGQAFAKYLHAEDVILEIDNKSLSNRPDLLSHVGIARELSVIFDLPFKQEADQQLSFDDGLDKLSVKVDNKEACPRYQAIKISGLKVQESPAWLKVRLVAVGQRPINNIVDLTNYVMLELGQPLHAFDAAKIKKITVRSAKKNETITTLDGQERILSEEDLVIASEDEPVALAGIMGGLDSGVEAGTESLILEAANFKASGIRQSSQKFGLRSESSLRFEKSLDAQLTEKAIRRFVVLLKKILPGIKIASALTDIGGTKETMPTINLDLTWLNRKIGQEIPRPQAIKILSRLGFSLTDEETDTIEVGVPSWRASKDIKNKEDLAEEILRFYGYDKIISQLPTETLRLPESDQKRIITRQVKVFLAYKHSLTEVYNYSFVGEDLLAKLNIDYSHHLRLANPLSEVHSLLRRYLAPGLIVNIRNNQAKADSLGFFEIGSVFSNSPGAIKKDKDSDTTLPYQEKRLSFCLADNADDIFGRAKGVISSLIRNLFGMERETEFALLSNCPGWSEEDWSAKVIVGGHEVGVIGRINRQASSNLNLKKAAVVAELNFTLLTELAEGQAVRHWREAPKYPPVNRDIAIVVPEKTLYNDVRNGMLDSNPLLRSVELFDAYAGDKLGSGHKSLAFHLEFRSDQKTLTAAEVDQMEKDLLDRLESKYDAHLRDLK